MIVSQAQGKRPLIAVNARFLLHNKLEGIGRFTHETLKIITQANPHIDFAFLFDRAYHPQFIYGKNVIPHVLYPPARHPVLWYTWFEWRVPYLLKKLKPQLFFSPDGYCSLRSKTPTYMVVHDLAFEHLPQQVPPLVAKYYRYFSPKFATHAQHIATVSQFTKLDLVTKYQIPEQKISVVGNGINTLFKPIPKAQQQQIRLQYTNQKPYFLFVGALHPRKNIGNILLAFDAFCKQLGQAPAKLVIAGRQAWQTQDITQIYQQLTYKDEVVFTGHLQTEQLADIAASAMALVYTSFFEGFGVPIIEAMACGTPVIISSRSAMPEVAGNAALIVQNPNDYNEIKQAMIQIFQQPNLANHLTILGFENAKRYSWQKTANLLWADMENLINKT